MTPTTCFCVRLVNSLDEERTVYAHFCYSYDEGGGYGGISPNYVLDEQGRSVPDSELPPDFWAVVTAHACDLRNSDDVCYVGI